MISLILYILSELCIVNNSSTDAKVSAESKIKKNQRSMYKIKVNGKYDFEIDRNGEGLSINHKKNEADIKQN